MDCEVGFSRLLFWRIAANNCQSLFPDLKAKRSYPLFHWEEPQRPGCAVCWVIWLYLVGSSQSHAQAHAPSPPQRWCSISQQLVSMIKHHSAKTTARSSWHPTHLAPPEGVGPTGEGTRKIQVCLAGLHGWRFTSIDSRTKPSPRADSRLGAQWLCSQIKFIHKINACNKIK